MIPENGREMLICLVFRVVQQTLLTDEEKDAIIAFLKALSSTE